MNVLLVHQNFPGQFKHLAPALVARGDRVVAMTMGSLPQIPGVEIHQARSAIGTSSKLASAQDFETKLLRAEASLTSARKIAAGGFKPDVIVGHPGWGDTMFLKEVWPDARLGIYCEFFYATQGTDADFDPEFPIPGDEISRRLRLKLRRLPQALHFPMANAGIAPTQFQADTYPPSFRSRISVIHDGIDTDAIAPKANAMLTLPNGRRFTHDDEIVTFVSRNLEPYRGYHVFMRALPELLRRRPNCNVFIIGANGVSYGAAPKESNWRDIFLNEVRDKLDMSRVHMPGSVQYPVFLELLALSRAHVYLTYPFVLSWSMLEAMSLGTPIIGSDTAPVREVIEHDHNGRLVDFFDGEALVDQVCEVLASPELSQRLGTAARRTAVDRFDLRTLSLPQQLAWVDELSRQSPRPRLLEDCF